MALPSELSDSRLRWILAIAALAGGVAAGLEVAERIRTPASPESLEAPVSPFAKRPRAGGPAVWSFDEGGERAIESLTVGDVFLSADERSGALVPVKVLRVLDHGEAATLLFRLEGGGTLLATGEHPLFDPASGGYREASTFKAGDSLASVSLSGLSRLRIAAIEPGPRRRVLDITVEGPRSNFLAAGLLVHNKAPLTQQD